MVAGLVEPAGEFGHAGRDLAFEELAEARVARVERGVHLGDAADHAGLVAGVDRDRIGCAGPERLVVFAAGLQGLGIGAQTLGHGLALRGIEPRHRGVDLHPAIGVDLVHLALAGPVSDSCLTRASSPATASSSSPASISLASMRLMLDLSRPRKGASCAAVMAPRASISSSVCTAEAEWPLAASVDCMKPSSRTMLRDAARMSSTRMGRCSWRLHGGAMQDWLYHTTNIPAASSVVQWRAARSRRPVFRRNRTGAG